MNLSTGAVTELGGGFSIAYFDPGCGTGSQAVLTKGGWANDTGNAPMSTTLVLADAATGKVSATVNVPGQITSAVPYDGQIAAAGSDGVEQIATSGKTQQLAATTSVPFRQWNLTVSTALTGTFTFPDGSTGKSELSALQFLLGDYC